MNKILISLKDVIVYDDNYKDILPINFVLNQGENVTLLGDNGSGKSFLTDILRGLKRTRSGESFYGYDLNSPSLYKFISHITFRSEYGGTDFFFQQRWNSTESDNVPVVNDQLCQIECDDAERARLYEVLNINNLLSKKIIMLSSGELRRMTLCKILLQKPRVLIIENPYVGLDIKMRNELSELFKAISESNDTSFIFVASHPRDIPPVTTHIYNVGNFSLSEKKKYSPEENQNDFRRDLFPQTDIDDSAEPVVELSSINIRYGERVLFKDFNWKINKGEKWLLSGANGSGKTTLLSLITADNPLAYSQKISFFGKKRGSGESIWDIKKKIGFISPELLRGYLVDMPARDIVASGFFDTVGLYNHPDAAQYDKADWWMNRFGIKDFSDRSFMKLSTGEQRLVLLARTFVKDPQLIILDEPMHELDEKNIALVSQIIEDYMSDKEKTMIYVSHYNDKCTRLITNQKTL